MVRRSLLRTGAAPNRRPLPRTKSSIFRLLAAARMAPCCVAGRTAIALSGRVGRGRSGVPGVGELVVRTSIALGSRLRTWRAPVPRSSLRGHTRDRARPLGRSRTASTFRCGAWNHRADLPYRRVKRLLDLTAASVLGLLLVPVAGLVLVVMALDMILVRRDRGSFLYRERRISRGREFDLLKFRCLQAGALRAMPPAAYARLFERDSRNLTWAGRHVLKPWYLDEVPQLLNVLRGSMSLVGPRPWPRAEVEQQVAEGFDYRNRIVAGWTGPSQVQKGGPETGPWLDLHYVEACRDWGALRLLRYDLRVLAATLSVIARRGGLND